MEESNFVEAVAAISSGEYSENDLLIVKRRLNELNKKELALKRKMEKDKNAFVKSKGKNTTQLKAIRKDIKDLKIVLNSLKH